MTDFREAFAQGLAASRDAERARADIRGMIDRLAAQVHEASGGRLCIERGAAPDGETEVSAASVTGAPREGIFRYAVAEAGYPITLRYFRTEERCRDLPAFEAALKRMLASPAVGGAFTRLMARTT